jgi:hypothetical protein
MKTLTVHQPWAWAIVSGIKAVENRTWPTRYRGPILIHAGKSRASLVHLAEVPEAPAPAELVFGAVIGGVEILDCVPAQVCEGRRFARGPWCWILANPWQLIHPLYLPGALGLRDAPSSLLAALGSAGPTKR